MFNYRLKRLNVWSVFKLVTTIGLLFGGFWGLLLGIFEGNVFGLLGGLFIGFIFGIVNGLTCAISAVLFNLLADHLGGLEVLLERKDAFLDSLEQPIPLVLQPPINNDPIASDTETLKQ
jgi:hypothetical protein